jgi:hypothetical protein
MKNIRTTLPLIPDPMRSLQQYERFHHSDISDLSDSDLLEELWALRPFLWELPSDHWLRGRCLELERDLKRRHLQELQERVGKIGLISSFPEISEMGTFCYL